jgi:mannose/fructose/N-acetylgalactosamine-specific phosphotransferase system component IIC
MSAPVVGAGEVLATALVGGLAALDNTAAFQLMLGQPVLAGSLAGAVAGAPVLGLEVGLTLQLLWSASSPLGASRFPDAPAGGTAGGAVAAFLAAGAGAPGGGGAGAGTGIDGAPAAFALAWGLLTGLLAAEGGWWTVSRMRRGNVRLIRRADRAASRGDPGALLRLNLAGALVSFARGFLVTLAAVLLGLGAGRLVLGGMRAMGPEAVPGAFGSDGLGAAPVGLRLLGIGVLAASLASRRPRDLLYLLAGASIALLALPGLAG